MKATKPSHVVGTLSKEAMTGVLEEPTQVVLASENAENENENANSLAKTLGYEGALTVGALEDEIRFYQRRSVEACLELGKRLLLLKELSPHGEFTQRLDLLGFAERTAQRFMQAAAKTSKSANLALLSGKIKTASAFLELITHDDDTVQALSELDDVECMSPSQLREQVRQIRADKNNQEARANTAESKLARLSATAPRLTKFTPHTEAIRAECLALQAEVELPINSLQKLFEEVLNNKEAPEAQDQLSQLWITAHTVAARAQDALATLQSLKEAHALSLPERIGSEHLMVSAEAEKWLNDYPMILNRHEGEKQRRKDKAADKAADKVSNNEGTAKPLKGKVQ